MARFDRRQSRPPGRQFQLALFRRTIIPNRVGGVIKAFNPKLPGEKNLPLNLAVGQIGHPFNWYYPHCYFNRGGINTSQTYPQMDCSGTFLPTVVEPPIIEEPPVEEEPTTVTRTVTETITVNEPGQPPQVIETSTDSDTVVSDDDGTFDDEIDELRGGETNGSDTQNS